MMPLEPSIEHASTAGIASHIPGVMGLLVEKEIQYFTQFQNPKQPFNLILGGSKVSTKNRGY